MKALALVTALSCLSGCYYGLTPETIPRAAKRDALILVAGAAIIAVGVSIAASGNSMALTGTQTDDRLAEGGMIAMSGTAVALAGFTGLVINAIEAACGGCWDVSL